MKDTVATAIGVLVSLTLALLLSRYIETHPIISVFYSLHLHLALACSAAMILAFALRRHLVTGLLLALSLLLAAQGVLMSRDFTATLVPTDDGAPVLRLLEFNILGDNFGNGDAITRTILRSGADLAIILEAAPLRRHLDELAAVYPYRIGCGEIVQVCDQLLLSRHPIENPKVVSLSNVIPERFYLASVTIAGQSVDVAAIHTTKPYFDRIQANELARAASEILATRGPLLLAGDFNSSSIAPDMRRFLQMTGLEHGPREPATWPVAAGSLGVAIDHVFARAPLKVKSVERLPDALGSNHIGLIAELVLSP